jgi:predicted permease
MVVRMISFLARDCKNILPILFIFDTFDFSPRHSTSLIFMFIAINTVCVWFGSFILNYVRQSNVRQGAGIVTSLRTWTFRCSNPGRGN